MCHHCPTSQCTLLKVKYYNNIIIIIIIIIIIMATVCCRCNGRKAKCSRCVCASPGRLCTSCRAPCCSNRSTLPPQPSMVNPSRSSSSQTSATCSTSAPAIFSLPPGPPPLPSLASVCSTRVFTLSHVPKGAQDAWAGVFAQELKAWAGVFTQELKAICSTPSDSSRWSRRLTLPKCIASSLALQSLVLETGRKPFVFFVSTCVYGPKAPYLIYGMRC